RRSRSARGTYPNRHKHPERPPPISLSGPAVRSMLEYFVFSCSRGLRMLGTTLAVRPFLERVARELLRVDPAEVQALADLIYATYQEGRFVFVCGNGGSGSNASHFCEDVGKGTMRRQDFDDDKFKRVRILSLTDNTPYILAWGNDEGFE